VPCPPAARPKSPGPRARCRAVVRGFGGAVRLRSHHIAPSATSRSSITPIRPAPSGIRSIGERT
jgi:hypothetical protein